MKTWYTLRSKPKREHMVASLLSNAGIEVYLPEVRVHHRHGKPATYEPFFPGYLFSKLDPLRGEIRLAAYTAGVLHVVSFEGIPCPVPDDVIDTLRDRLSREPTATPPFRRGDRVVITSGPLQDIEGVFDSRLSPTGRVRVLVRMLARYCPAEVRAEQLRLIARTA